MKPKTIRKIILPPDSFLSMASTAYIASTGLFYFAVLPLIVGALVGFGGYSDEVAGKIASMNVLGSTFGAIAAAALMQRVSPRLMCCLGLVTMVIGDFLSGHATSAQSLYLVRLLSGVGGGMTASVALGMMAHLRNSDRGYGGFMFFQAAMAGVTFYLLPQWLPTIGIEGLFSILAAVGLLALLPLPLLSLFDTLPKKCQPYGKLLRAPKVVLALLAFVIFEIGISSCWAFVERIGINHGFDSETVGLVLSLTTVTGIIGALSVAAVCEKLGRFRSLSAGLILIISACFPMILLSDEAAFFGANLLLGFAWAFSVPLFQTILADLDIEGRVVALGVIAGLGGITLGPLAASLVIEAYGLSQLIWLVTGCIAVALILTTPTALGIDRQKKHERGSESALGSHEAPVLRSS